MVFRIIFVLACLTFDLSADSLVQRPNSFTKNPVISKLKSQCPQEKIQKSLPPLIGKKTLIILDPGHGGHDVGTQSISKPRYQEKSLNLITAQFVQSYLNQQGYHVEMTRIDDTFVSLEKRAQMANEKKPALFVSIHYNSAPSAEAEGVEVFFYQSKEKKDRVNKSKRLAQSILKNVIGQTQAKSRGVKHGNYAVIRETKMPAVLIEGGFLTNEKELQKLKDPSYIKQLAWGIVKGIEEYLKPKNESSKKLSPG